MIKEFKNGFEWLSNFEPCDIILDGIVYPSVEHAFMSAKCNDEEWKRFCSDKNNKAGKVKIKSRTVKLVDNWDIKKFEIMKKCLEQKFNQEPYKTKLKNTGNEYIQEGNMWNDKIWGVCLKTGKGQNNLGKLIMEIRDNL